MVIKVSVPKCFQFKVVPTIKNLMFFRQGDVHYIGGSDVLPPPLEPEEEAMVIADMQGEYAEQARSVLIEHNLRLVVYIAKRFDNTGIGVEDLISIGTIGLIKAIHSYNPDKSIKLVYLRRNSKTKAEVSIDEPLNVDWDGNELLLSDILGTDEDVIYKDIENQAERLMLGKAMEKLSDRERLIVNLRYGLTSPDEREMTQKEVADYLGISQSYISRLEKKIIRRLKKEMVKMHCILKSHVVRFHKVKTNVRHRKTLKM